VGIICPCWAVVLFWELRSKMLNINRKYLRKVIIDLIVSDLGG